MRRRKLFAGWEFVDAGLAAREQVDDERQSCNSQKSGYEVLADEHSHECHDLRTEANCQG